MKQGLFLAAFFILIGIVAWKKEQAPKTYTVTLSLNQWAAHLKYIANARIVMMQSTMPANVVTSWSDSLSLLSEEINRQVSQQMQKEAADTSKPVTNKHK
jgi:hypothetical protein